MIFETNREGTINGKQGLAGEELQLGTAVGLEAEADWIHKSKLCEYSGTA